MGKKSMHGISRMDNDSNRTHGWLVTIQRRGEIYRMLFSDKKQGGKKKALTVAKAFRDAIIAEYPLFSKQEHANLKKRSNQSGIVGVCRVVAFETKTLPPEKQRWNWVAAWPLPDGRRKRVKFSVQKFGEEQARALAIRAREEGLKALEGDFDPHRERVRRARLRQK
ncbi:MAG: AP2 domain-containing protein [Candidatus Moraniibacteriota bacterium]|nr:MAG: AP2 domain-containing protein [Candidatus Moranbacteria bacterium]